MPVRKSRTRGIVGALVAVGAVAGLMPASASAAACSLEKTSKPFAWLMDFNEYFTAPGGAFEPGDAGWAHASGSTVIKRDSLNRSYGVGQLSLPSGGSATSPAFCVDGTRPHLRTGATAKGGSLKIEALVDGRTVVLSSLSGSKHRMPRISDKVPLSTVLGIPAGASKPVNLRMTAVGAAWTVDGVAIDPRSSR